MMPTIKNFNFIIYENKPYLDYEFLGCLFGLINKDDNFKVKLLKELEVYEIRKIEIKPEGFEINV